VLFRSKKCINTECKFYRVREESRCKETDDVTICECHNDNPKSRLSSINTSSPFKAELAFYQKVGDALAIERNLHQQYKDKRKNGEWFELSEDEIVNIKESLSIKARPKI
jgi:hypothetical protein